LAQFPSDTEELDTSKAQHVATLAARAAAARPMRTANIAFLLGKTRSLTCSCRTRSPDAVSGDGCLAGPPQRSTR
jgi:hypothetical protein